MRLIVLAICITACAVRAQLMATKLHHAAQHADSSELAQLLEGNPNTNIGDALGRTPLMIAVENQREANVILLLKHDTNLSQVDNSGMTALDIANKRSDAGPIGVLLALAWRAPQLPEPAAGQVHWPSRLALFVVLCATSSAALALLKRLGQCCSPPLARRGNSPAQPKSFLRRCEEALFAGPPQHDGWSPLMFAAQGESADLVARLMRAGADPLRGTPRGDSAMSIAKHHGSREVRIAMGSWVLEATGTEPAGDALLSAAGVVPSAAL
ncbi:hypothetical protein FNF28_03348 [Cafeteria roenbergensis]|uniref:Uncharacterized protein n=1 Tax=Cafeteria roenbergensis TaxID=33653 RepID=A0A5A8DKF1_CAFRO|nr:hypothetical protein FNF28_03348 [Cafeteria roenbergensis]